jgi:hypothetical protein
MDYFLRDNNHHDYSALLARATYSSSMLRTDNLHLFFDCSCHGSLPKIAWSVAYLPQVFDDSMRSTNHCPHPHSTLVVSSPCYEFKRTCIGFNESRRNLEEIGAAAGGNSIPSSIRGRHRDLGATQGPGWGRRGMAVIGSDAGGNGCGGGGVGSFSRKWRPTPKILLRGQVNSSDF